MDCKPTTPAAAVATVAYASGARHAMRSDATSQCEHEVEYRASFDVIIGRLLIIRHLLPTKYETLLGRRNALLLLNALLNPRDRLVALNVYLDFLARQRLHLDLRNAREARGIAKRRGGQGRVKVRASEPSFVCACTPRTRHVPACLAGPGAPLAQAIRCCA